MTKNPTTVLVVEANVLLRQFVAEMVTANGCAALTVCTADEAMALLQTRPDIALLITNVVMRGSMNGIDLAHAVDKRWPQVRVIILSGQPDLSESDFPRRCRFMQKPYHDRELAFEIRALVDAPDRDRLASDDAQA